MKEVFSAFGSEVFRPLVTLLLPGAMAVTPYFIALMQKYGAFYRMVGANHTEAAFVLSLVALFVGLVIEDLGTRFEARVLDRLSNNRTNNQFEKVWWKYLTMEFEVEPPGRRYLRALVIRLKFELGAALALLLTLPGVVFCVHVPNGLLAWGIPIGAIVLSAYLGYIEAPTTHRVLGELREKLVAARHQPDAFA